MGIPRKGRIRWQAWTAAALLALALPALAQQQQEEEQDGGGGTVAPAGICIDCPGGGPGGPGGNIPPQVYLTAPTHGQSFTAGSVVTLSATASDMDGIDHVQFLIDGANAGSDDVSPYSTTWTATAGSHTVQARAYDNLLASSTTIAITINVTAANQAPSVTLTAPANGQSFVTGSAVTFTATASDADGSIDRVEFLVDGSEVGQDTSSPYSVNWTVQPGSHTIQARAVDNLGLPKTTAAITVQGGSPPPVVASATRTYHYDQYQRLCKVVEPETGATLMGYDAAGNLAWSATGLPAGTACDLEGDTAAILARKAVRTYDARNRITALDFADGKADVDYTYTPAGQLATITAPNGGGNVVTTAYTYNRRGLPTRERMTYSTIDWSVTYAYDLNGHLATLGYPGGVSVAYAPNALGQPTQAGGYATGVSYYPNGAMKQFTYGNGIVHTLTRNVRGLPDRSLDAYGSTKYLDDGYDYDANGNVAAISDGATGRNQRGNRTMSYDGLDRLTAVQSPMYGATGTSYQYDTLDNLRHVVAPGRNHGYCYDANNRLTAIRNGSCSGTVVTSLGYDVQGNLASKAGVTYTFDHGNRLRAVNSPATSYLYDGHGRRFRDYTAASRYSVYSLTGQLLYANSLREGEQEWYISLNGSLVAIRNRDGGTGVISTLYQHTDALGSPVVVTNESRTVVKRNEYEPYGKLVGAAMEDGPGYTGHMADAATGLVYMQQRYYDPSIDGRFPSVDPVTPISPGGTFNRYWYANANPYRFTDPDGRYVCEGGEQQCKAVKEAIDDIKKAASSYEEGSAEAQILNRVVEFYGEEDVKNKVIITTTRDENVGSAVTRNGITTININVSLISATSTGEVRKAYAAGTVAHEGNHGVDQRRFGMPKNGTQQNWSEKRAVTAQALTYKGMGLADPGYGVLLPDGKLSPQRIEFVADQSTGAWLYCANGGGC